jgi:hypothetical protein
LAHVCKIPSVAKQAADATTATTAARRPFGTGAYAPAPIGGTTTPI